MIEKARENLSAAEKLVKEGLANAAASRAYYAAYHICWFALDKAGEKAPENRPGDVWWPHKSIASWARMTIPDFDCDDEEEFDNILYFRRIKADYDPDSVLEWEARESVEIAAGLLKRFSGDENE